MKQFSLEKYLENPSRKVVTREGRPVRIVCWDSPNKGFPIVGFIDDNPTVFVWDKYGYALSGHRESNRDLFFADEEELTEFEKELQIIISDASHWTSDDGSISTYCQFGDKEIKKISGQILDLARKELTKNLPQKNDTIFELLEIFGEWLGKNGYSFKFPKSDTLKDLPKWKDVSGKNGAGTKDYKIVGYYLVKGNYAIYLEDLEKLPKEE